MSEEIKVSVNSWGPGRSLALSWIDPMTGKRKTQSAKTKDWNKAERVAYEKEKELEAGCVSPSKITWDEAVKRYDEEYLITKVPKSRSTYMGSLRHVKRVLNLQHLAKLTTSTLSTFQAKLKAEGMKDSTLAHHLRHIKAAARWWARLGMLRSAPLFDMPDKGEARPRPITGEEYERILAAVPVARPKDYDQWKRYITGLWLSGLRRSEALRLTWDQDGDFCVNVADEVFTIRPEGQKSGKAETCPMAPDFTDWIRTIPEDERTGRVFHLIDTRTNQPLNADRVGKIVESISRKAGVKVGTRTTKVDGKPVEIPTFAGCHSFRRGFGSRWARRVTSSVLKTMMRHSSIATTERYYIHLKASDVARELRQQFGCQNDTLHQSCNNPPAERVGQ